MKSLSDARQLSIPIACRKFRFLIRDWISAGHQNIGISEKPHACSAIRAALASTFPEFFSYLSRITMR
jgi:hypothetical protein